MKALRIGIPVITTVVTTVIVVLIAVWLTGLVPDGEWAGFLKAAIIVILVGATLFVIAWSAYFSYVVREGIEKLLAREAGGIK
jgi:hypothetical protein